MPAAEPIMVTPQTKRSRVAAKPTKAGPKRSKAPAKRKAGRRARR
jgi:hypothetical protein